MSVQERLIASGEALHMGGDNPMVNPFSAGQQGPVSQPGMYVLNASRTRRNVFARLMEFPKWIEYMPNPQIWRTAIKSFIETHTTITGLDQTLTHEAVQTAQGRNNNQQTDAGNVTRAQSTPTHTTVDKFGGVYQNMLKGWLRYGICDPDTGHPGIGAINSNVPDHLPDMYSITCLYTEPDAYMRKAVRAFWCTNMVPNTAGPDTGERDPNTGPQTVELGVEFSAQQDVNWGTLQLANRELTRSGMAGLMPWQRAAWQDAPTANVLGAEAGMDKMVSDYVSNQTATMDTASATS